MCVCDKSELVPSEMWLELARRDLRSRQGIASCEVNRLIDELSCQVCVACCASAGYLDAIADVVRAVKGNLCTEHGPCGSPSS